MKRIISVICALTMLLCCFGAAAQDMNSDLSEITLMVKQALKIGDDYEDFSGSNYDGMWDLYWSGMENELSVTCDENGRIYNYYIYDYDYVYSGDYEPRYPAYTVQQLSDIADEFLGRVVTGDEEGWIIDSVDSTLQHGSEARVSINGRIALCEKPTDITFDLSIDMSTGTVISFYRADSYMRFNDRTVDMTEAIAADAARKLLNDTIRMEAIYYITNENDMAQLVYMPADDNRYVVRASDGELINMEDAYNEIYSYASDEAAETYGSPYGEEYKLTEAELEGISIYDNAMGVEDLDELLRGMIELGISEDFYISSADYYENDSAPIASLRYVRKLTDDEIELRGCDGEYDQYDTKHLTVAATDGKLIDMYSYYAGRGSNKTEADDEALKAVADAFVEKYYPEYADYIDSDRAMLLENTYSWNRMFDVKYVRTHNGYPFRENWINVVVNADTGCIDRFDYSWNINQEFYEYSEAEMISADAAREAYLAGFEFENAFVTMPSGKVNEWEALYELVYCWQLRDIKGFYAVEAATGNALSVNESDDDFVYNDIAGHEYEDIIARLGSYGIGFSGGEFEPDSEFTVRDALVFISQGAQYNYGVPIEERSFGELVMRAEELGANGFNEYEEDHVLTRGEFAGILACMSGYGKAAALNGIFECGFTDNDTIAAEEYGKVAIAYALGLIDVDSDGMINAGAALTRAEAAVIFNNLLSMK